MFHTRMRAERLKRGWSQTRLGSKASLSASDVSRIETRRLQPYPEQLARLARALRLSPDELLESVRVDQ